MQCRRLSLGLNTLVHPLHTEQTYKRQGHHTFETLLDFLRKGGKPKERSHKSKSRELKRLFVE